MNLRAIFGAALVAGSSYFLAELWLAGQFAFGLSKAAQLTLFAWKGTGIALLALWCAMQARERDGWLIAAVMGFGALGDVLIEWQLEAGAAAFLLGHVVAIALYWRNRRAVPTASQRGAAAALALGTPVIAWLLTHDAGVAVYATGLGLMAGTAWLSCFPRYPTGIGAVLFVASDLLIFARMGPLAGSSVPDLLVWPLYFAGQTLIAYGVVRTLTTDARGRTP